MLTRTLAWAAVAACGLPGSVRGGEMPGRAAGAAALEQIDGASCAADAKPARLDFVLKDVNNRNVKLSDFKGKVILLNFWATWCGPCRIEIPWFIEFQQRYGKDGLQVIGISADDPLDQLRPFVEEMKMSYPVLQGLGRNNVLDAYGPIPGLPATVLIRRDGRICSKQIGMGSRDAFETAIKALL